MPASEGLGATLGTFCDTCYGQSDDMGGNGDQVPKSVPQEPKSEKNRKSWKMTKI